MEDAFASNPELELVAALAPVLFQSLIESPQGRIRRVIAALVLATTGDSTMSCEPPIRDWELNIARQLLKFGLEGFPTLPTADASLTGMLIGLLFGNEEGLS